MDFAARRLTGAFDVDPWGLDGELVDGLAPLAALRWSLSVEGAEQVPETGPALVLLNRRVGLTEPLVAIEAVRRANGRHLRILGVPDVAGVGSVLRRLGGVPGGPEDLATLLRAGELGAVLLERRLRHSTFAGSLDAAWVAPALEQRVPVVPAIAVGYEFGRRWRVVFGRALEAPNRRGPLAEADWADRCRRAVQELLDEAFPPRWPFS